MATFVLVHGAFHGGWCYRDTAAILRNAGHLVVTPTLSGVAERHEDGVAPINLTTHVADIVGLIEDEGLEGVVLLGHSYSGMVITGVAGSLGRRLRSLVYLDAILPEDGQSLFDVVGPEATLATLAVASADGLMVQPLPASFFDVSADNAAWVDRMCTPHPLATFVQAIRFTGREAEVRHRTYIAARDHRFDAHRRTMARLVGEPGWRTFTVEGGHDIMIDQPARLAEILIAEVDR